MTTRTADIKRTAACRVQDHAACPYGAWGLELCECICHRPVYACAVPGCNYTTKDIAGDGVFHAVLDHGVSVHAAKSPSGPYFKPVTGRP